MNVYDRQEAIATDTMYAETLGVENGSTSAHIFVGVKSFVTDVYGMKYNKQFV